MTIEPSVSDAETLLPCPWCQRALELRGGVNPYGRHPKDTGCFGERMAVVNIPFDVDAWNRRSATKRPHSMTLNLSDVEITALEELAERQQLSREGVLRQGLRHYQLLVHGEPDLGPMLDPALTNSGDPNGIVTASSLGVTAASATAFTYDELFDLEHSVDPAYRRSPKARFMFADGTLKVLRKLKDLATFADDDLEGFHPVLPDREGFKLVPVEPTGEMWVAGRKVYETEAEKYRATDTTAMAMALADRAPEKIYRAMLAASPATGEREPSRATDTGVETHGLDTQSQVFFYEQDFYVLSNFSAFNLLWDGVKFATSEHAYHWEKFAGVKSAGNICQQISFAPSAHEAFKIAERNKDKRRADWDMVKIDIMRDILRAKVDQHEYVRRKLLATGDRELIENSWRDDFWGWGPNRDGQNMLGKLWMEVRAELRPAPPHAVDQGRARP